MHSARSNIGQLEFRYLFDEYNPYNREFNGIHPNFPPSRFGERNQCRKRVPAWIFALLCWYLISAIESSKSYFYRVRTSGSVFHISISYELHSKGLTKLGDKLDFLMKSSINCLNIHRLLLTYFWIAKFLYL